MQESKEEKVRGPSKYHVIVGVAVIALALSGCATFARIDPAIASKPFTYIAEFPEKSEDEIFSYCTLWIAHAYDPADRVITVKDEKLRQIRGTAVGSILPIGDPFLRKFRYSVSIDIMPGRARVEFSNLRAVTYKTGNAYIGGISDLTWQVFYYPVKEYFDALGAKFKETTLGKAEDR
jgi:hypothetical protein